MLVFSQRGIYCPIADFYIDPWAPVERAVITHAHTDHARGGHGHYLAHRLSVAILRHRLGAGVPAQGVEYGTAIERNGVRISLHPAGHVIGSAQVRVEFKGEVWTVSGDYKLENDGVSLPYEPVQCHVFVTESTFGLPVYRWPEQRATYDEINAWWRENKHQGKVSVLGCYALGKAQRVLAHLDRSIGPVFAHESIERMTRVLRENGAALPEIACLPPGTGHADVRGGLVLLPLSTAGAPWMRRLSPYSLGYASGWMIARGSRQWQGIDRGFVLSDHADWTGLNAAVAATGAKRIFVTHGYTGPFARWLRENGYDATAPDRMKSV